MLRFGYSLLAARKYSSRVTSVFSSLGYLSVIQSRMKGRVLVFSITGCPFCIRAKTKLSEIGVDYVDVNFDVYPNLRESVQKKTGRKTVPQIFFNEKHIGGFSELDSLSEDELQNLIKYVQENEPPPDAPPLPEPGSEKQGLSSDDFSFACEMDEYAMLVREMRQSGIVRDHGWLLNVQKNAFTGKEAVDWLVSTKQIDRDHAIEMCKHLVERHFGHAVKGKQREFRDDDTIYRFLEDDESNALNAHLTSDCEPRPAGEVSEELRRLILNLYNKYLSPDGKGVDYKGMGESDQFKAYVKHTAELKRVNLDESTREEKIAFFINVYNALVIHAYVSIGPPVNLWQRYKFFNTVSYIIGGYIYSLNDMENGILRSNRKAIGAIFRPFSKDDPRMKIALPEPEPKVHFALVCGAKSCPPIKTYSAKGIDDQLKLAAEAFLEGDDGCQVNMDKREIKISQIFKWYSEDFGTNKEEIVHFVICHMGEGEKQKQMKELLDSKNFKFGHLSYNWGLNKK